MDDLKPTQEPKPEVSFSPVKTFSMLRLFQSLAWTFLPQMGWDGIATPPTSIACFGLGRQLNKLPPHRGEQQQYVSSRKSHNSCPAHEKNSTLLEIAGRPPCINGGPALPRAHTPTGAGNFCAQRQARAS